MSRQTNLIIFSLTLLITGLGLNILLASSSFIAHQHHGDIYFFIKKQSIFAILGIFLLFLFSRISYGFWYKSAWPIYFISLVLLLLVFVPPLGKRAGGASRWIQIGFFSLQPSDVAKFAVILVISRIFSRETEMTWGKIGLLMALIILPVILIVLEPDFGTAAHLLVSVGVLLCFTGFPLYIMAALSVLSIPIVYKSVISVPYRWDRVKAFLDPYTYRYEGAYQLIASFKAFAAGDLFGKGFGEGLRRHNLQARHTDFILAVVAEDLGFMGILFIQLLFFFTAIYGIYLMSKVENHYGRLLGTGILLLFIHQAILNTAVTMGLLPTTGINLPLISYGGTSLVAYLSMMGVLLNILREESL